VKLRRTETKKNGPVKNFGDQSREKERGLTDGNWGVKGNKEGPGACTTIDRITAKRRNRRGTAEAKRGIEMLIKGDFRSQKNRPRGIV